jgi:tellurite resistance protein TehA-like permease
MTLAIALAGAYLAINIAIMIWFERERSQGRAPAGRALIASRVLRYGPPLAGAAYLVAIAGDWPFVVFVGIFFAGAFWLLNGLLAYTVPPKGSERDRDR